MLMRSPSTGKLSPTRPPPARITSAGPWAVTSSELDRHQLARLVDPVGGRDRLPARPARALGARQQRAAALAVVGALDVDEAALGAVQSHDDDPPSRPRRA